MRPLRFKVAAFTLLIGLVAASPYPIYAQPVDSLAVARQWVSALATGNASSALALLDNDSSLIVSTSPDGEIASYSNKDEIAGVLHNLGSDNTKIKLVDRPHLVLGTVTWTERRSSDSLGKLGLSSVDVVANAIIQDGKIRSLVYELTPLSAARVQRAQAGHYPPLGMPRTGSGDAPPTILLTLFGAATLSLGLSIYFSRRRSVDSN